MSEAELSATLTKLEAFTSVDEFMSNDKVDETVTTLAAFLPPLTRLVTKVGEQRFGKARTIVSGFPQVLPVARQARTPTQRSARQ